MSAWLVPLESLARRRGGDDPRTVGGKAARLAWLIRHDFAVPEGWVLPADAFQATLRDLSAGVRAALAPSRGGGRAGYARAAEARQEILRAPLPKGLEAELADAVDGSRGETHRGGSRCDRARPARTARSCRWPASPRRASACAARTSSPTRCARCGRRSRRGARSRTSRRTAFATSEWRWSSRGWWRPKPRASCSRARPGSTRRTRIATTASSTSGSASARRSSTASRRRTCSGSIARGRIVDSTIARKVRAIVVGDDGLSEIDVPRSRSPGARSRERLDGARRDRALRLEKLERRRLGRRVRVRPRARPGSSRRGPSPAAAFPTAATRRRCGATSTSARRSPASPRRSRGRSPARSARAGFRRAFAALGCSVPKHARLVGNVLRALLSEPVAVHAHRRAGAVARSAHAGRARRRRGRRRARAAGGRRVAHAASTRASRSRRRASLQEQFRLDDDVDALRSSSPSKRCALHGALDLAILPDEGLARTIRDIQALLERTGNVMLTCASSALGTHLVLKTMLSRVAPIGAERLAQGLTSGIRDLESARPAIGIMRVVNLARRSRRRARRSSARRRPGSTRSPTGPRAARSRASSSSTAIAPSARRSSRRRDGAKTRGRCSR